ncbi:MAG: hypothetical protein ACXAEU_22575 [Candidatus Hodarchaeales archaeon]
MDQRVACPHCGKERRISGVGKDFKCLSCERGFVYKGPFHHFRCQACEEDIILTPEPGTRTASCSNCGLRYELPQQSDKKGKSTAEECLDISNNCGCEEAECCCGSIACVFLSVSWICESTKIREEATPVIDTGDRPTNKKKRAKRPEKAVKCPECGVMMVNFQGFMKCTLCGHKQEW